MRKYEQHPLSAAFPSMGDGDLMLMRQDMREFGQRDPGMLYEGMILDGWHRYLCCVANKQEFIATEYTGDDPAGFVISRNRHRRHMTLGQITVAIVACRKWRPAGVQNDAMGALSAPMKTVAELVEETGASERTVQKAKVVVTAGLTEPVRDGVMTVNEAVHVAKGTAPKKAAPKVEEPDDAFEGQDPLDQLEATLKENEQLRKTVEKLSATDQGAALAKALAAQAYAEDQQGKAMNQAAMHQREVKAWQAWWAKVVLMVKLEKRSDLLGWIKARL